MRLEIAASVVMEVDAMYLSIKIKKKTFSYFFLPRKRCSAGFFFFCFLRADDLMIKANPDLNRTLILVVFGVFALEC